MPAQIMRVTVTHAESRFLYVKRYWPQVPEKPHMVPPASVKKIPRAVFDLFKLSFESGFTFFYLC